jgi:CheY-like chemotaxis protein
MPLPILIVKFHKKCSIAASIASSLHPLSTAGIPELDTFDPATFDALPIWGSPAAPVPTPAILVVDDKRHVGQIVGRLLQETLLQYEIITVTHPAAALDQLSGRAVALMIIDFNMPDHNGIQLTAQIKGRSPHTQVLLMTAYSTTILHRLAQHHGVDYYLPKPFQLTALEELYQSAFWRIIFRRPLKGRPLATKPACAD